jgi:hypothetical protein
VLNSCSSVFYGRDTNPQCTQHPQGMFPRKLGVKGNWWKICWWTCTLLPLSNRAFHSDSRGSKCLLATSMTLYMTISSLADSLAGKQGKFKPSTQHDNMVMVNFQHFPMIDYVWRILPGLLVLFNKEETRVIRQLTQSWYHWPKLSAFTKHAYSTSFPVECTLHVLIQLILKVVNDGASNIFILRWGNWDMERFINFSKVI